MGGGENGGGRSRGISKNEGNRIGGGGGGELRSIDDDDDDDDREGGVREATEYSGARGKISEKLHPIRSSPAEADRLLFAPIGPAGAQSFFRRRYPTISARRSARGKLAIARRWAVPAAGTGGGTDRDPAGSIRTDVVRGEEIKRRESEAGGGGGACGAGG